MNTNGSVNEAVSQFGRFTVRQGIKNQKTLFWVRIALNDKFREALKSEYREKGYCAVNITPYYVGQQCWKEIKESGHFGTNNELPNLDKNSGNLHPKRTDKCQRPPILSSKSERNLSRVGTVFCQRQ